MPSATSDDFQSIKTRLNIFDAAAVWNQTFLFVSLMKSSLETSTKLLMITSAQDTKASAEFKTHVYSLGCLLFLSAE